MIHLSGRLQSIAANVKSNGVVADIGCDHGFMPIYLIQNGQAKHAIALDVHPGPLSRARENVSRYHMTEQIDLRLSDGTKALEIGEADTILISGMGGILLTRILEEGREVVQSAQELVLSPQSDIHLVRRCVHALGFFIAHEEMVVDQGKFYVILRAVPGKEYYTEEIDYIYGKQLIDGKDEGFIRFLMREEKRVNRILHILSKKLLSESSILKKQELEKEWEQLSEIRNRMCLEESGDKMEERYGKDQSVR